MYGHHYSPTTISNISKATKENVAVFHDRTLEANYLSYFLTELTFVKKESIHIALGIMPERLTAVPGYEITTNENISRLDLLNDLHKQRS